MNAKFSRYYFYMSTNRYGDFQICINVPLKICGDSICRPLNISFKTCLRTGKFPLEWKKPNIVPIHNKGDKQAVKKVISNLFHFYRFVVKYL